MQRRLMFGEKIYSAWDNVARKRAFQAPVDSDIGLLNGKVLSTWLLPFVYNIGLSGFRASILAWIFIDRVIFPEQVLRNSSTVSGNGYA